MSKLLVTVLKMAAMVSKTSFEMAPVVLSLESVSQTTDKCLRVPCKTHTIEQY